jgi:hypothetical protein
VDDFFPSTLDWIYSDEDEDPTLELLGLSLKAKVSCSI